MATTAQRMNRTALARAVREEQRRIRALAIEDLRRQIAAVHTRRRELVDRVRAQCKIAKSRVQTQVEQRRAELRREVAEMKQAERNRCALRKARVRIESESKRDWLKREARERRRDQAATARIERHERRESKKHSRAERQGESDDEVRQNIDPEFVPVFNVVRAKIRQRPGMSRTEAFLHWLEEHPAELWALREELAEKRLRALLREQQEAERALRKVGGRVSAKARRAKLEEAPF